MVNVGQALGFPFRGRHVWPNIGLLLVCFLIPIIGPLVALGYQCGVERMLVTNINADAPRFDFGKFSVYLSRGVMPFAASMLSALVLMPIVIFLWIAVMASVFLVKDHVLIFVMIIVAAAVIWLVTALLFGILMIPVIFRASVEQVVLKAFEKTFVLDYLKRVGWLTLWVNFQIMLVTLVAFLILCIPFVNYAILGILNQVQSHVRTQLYLEYLDRGGTPLAIIPELPEVEPAFPVVMQPPHEPRQNG